MNPHGARLGDMRLARGEGVGVALARDDQAGAVAADAFGLGRRAMPGTKIVAGTPRRFAA
jgi:hypothetical protein